MTEPAIYDEMGAGNADRLSAHMVGYPCPVCGGHGNVIGVPPSADDSVVYLRKRCNDCFAEYTTVETIGKAVVLLRRVQRAYLSDQEARAKLRRGLIYLVRIGRPGYEAGRFFLAFNSKPRHGPPSWQCVGVPKVHSNEKSREWWSVGLAVGPDALSLDEAEQKAIEIIPVVARALNIYPTLPAVPERSAGLAMPPE